MPNCHICENPITNPESCPLCATNLAEPNEKLIKSSIHVSYGPASKKGMATSLGNLFLTNKRLLWFDTIKDDDSITYELAEEYGLIGHALGSLVDKLTVNLIRDNSFSLPLDNIDSIEIGKFVFSKALVIHMNDGEGIKLDPKPLAEWIEAIQNAKVSC